VENAEVCYGTDLLPNDEPKLLSLSNVPDYLSAVAETKGCNEFVKHTA
jgi:hypothetical protein